MAAEVDDHQPHCKIKKVKTFIGLIVFSGARGIVDIPFTTDEFTAKPEKDYTHTEGVLRFEDGEVSRQIIIPIVNSRHAPHNHFQTIHSTFKQFQISNFFYSIFRNFMVSWYIPERICSEWILST